VMAAERVELSDCGAHASRPPTTMDDRSRRRRRRLGRSIEIDEDGTSSTGGGRATGAADVLSVRLSTSLSVHVFVSVSRRTIVLSGIGAARN